MNKREIVRHLRYLADMIALDLRDTTMDIPFSGPDQTRENVVGTSSKAKNKNLGNSGFSGGQLTAA